MCKPLVVVHLHTIPVVKPADEVGIVLMERALTNVVQALSAVSPQPNTNE
jgi:hypothetical protein